MSRVIKSKFSKNYYTNFRVRVNKSETTVTVIYDLIDARREQVSRTYVYTEGSSYVESIHTHKWERTIKASGLQFDLMMYINELIQRKHDQLAYEAIKDVFDDKPYDKNYNYATLLMINLATFAILFFFGITNIIGGETTDEAFLGLVACLVGALPALSAVLIHYTHGEY